MWRTVVYDIEKGESGGSFRNRRNRYSGIWGDSKWARGILGFVFKLPRVLTQKWRYVQAIETNIMILIQLEWMNCEFYAKR